MHTRIGGGGGGLSAGADVNPAVMELDPDMLVSEAEARLAGACAELRVDVRGAVVGPPRRLRRHRSRRRGRPATASAETARGCAAAACRWAATRDVVWSPRAVQLRRHRRRPRQPPARGRHHRLA